MWFTTVGLCLLVLYMELIPPQCFCVEVLDDDCNDNKRNKEGKEEQTEERKKGNELDYGLNIRKQNIYLP